MARKMNPKSLANLRPNSMRPEEERRAVASMGGKRRAEVQAERKVFREAVADMLANPAAWRGKVLTDPVSGGQLDNLQAALIVSTMQEALKGNIAAAKQIVEWLGESNTPAGVTINVQLGK